MSRQPLFEKLQNSSMYGKINYIKPFDKVVVPLWINSQSIRMEKNYKVHRYHYSHKDKHLAHLYDIKTRMIFKNNLRILNQYGIIFDEYIKKETSNE